MKYLLLSFTIIFNFSCAAQFSTPEMKNNFAEQQIKDLEAITDFFKNQICTSQSSDFKECFSQILPELVEYGWQPILENVDFEEQKRLYKSISPSTFKEIWEFTKVTDYQRGEQLKGIVPTYDGKYRKFLSDVARNNKEIFDYYQRLEDAGDFESMGLLQQNISQKPSDFDLNNPNIQLIIAIHYLSQNDQQKRSDKWSGE